MIDGRSLFGDWRFMEDLLLLLGVWSATDYWLEIQELLKINRWWLIHAQPLPRWVWLIHRLSDRLIDWLIDRIIDWLKDRLDNWSVYGLIDVSIFWVLDRLLDWLIHRSLDLIGRAVDCNFMIGDLLLLGRWFVVDSLMLVWLTEGLLILRWQLFIARLTTQWWLTYLSIENLLIDGSTGWLIRWWTCWFID